MDDKTSFHAAMADLLQQMGISARPAPGDEFYELRFSDDSTIHFAQIEPGSLDVAAEAGTLRDPAAPSVMLRLLELNGAVAGKPLIVVSIDPRSRQVYLRARLELAHADRTRLSDLTWAIAERLRAARACLSLPAAKPRDPRLPGAGTERNRPGHAGSPLRR